MSPDITPRHPFDFSREEPIPGYRTIELLGRGGYGEVWKGTAPGGVSKAIKLIFGNGDPSRAAMELRSLNRIKDVRHPLLLSIDRIEQQGDTLIIVTELGERNLKEHYLHLRAQGRPGIPQHELLRFLRDAADVLDFIYEECALQHLDIKPENLLVFGKRLKVADFGLVKNIYERSASLVHGLTPTYAAPEIFEGTPSRSSDQYSLAIVYQEMLTGTLPFDGVTAARLAAQHLREAPVLRGLPVEQQPVIARALSKDPGQRFPSCQALMDELAAAVERTATSVQPAAPSESLSAPPPIAVRTAEAPIGPAGSRQRESRLTLDSPAEHPDAIPPRSDQDECHPQACPPTILLGIGGTAAHVLRRVRQRIGDRLGSLRDAPAVRMLLIDTDVDQLNQINREREAWEELETIAVPLRNSSEYRQQGQLFRNWLSRRWLYNIPRSLQTEGLRPLGRLALVSHAERVLTALRAAVRTASFADSAQRSSAALGISFQPGPPRVLLVASISGGTGSGMLLDLAYAARAELKAAGFANAQIEGILLHSTPRGKARDRACANAYATLLELSHYSRRGNYYPGESALQVPPFHGNNPTFAPARVIHLGENLDTPRWLRAADDVAEYVYCTAFTPLGCLCGAASQENTAADAAQQPSATALRMHQVGGCNGAIVQELSRQLCIDLTTVWRGEPFGVDGAATASLSAATLVLGALAQEKDIRFRTLDAAASQQLQTCGISLDNLCTRAREVLVQELGQDERPFLRGLMQEALRSEKTTGNSLEDKARVAITLLNQLTGQPGADCEAAEQAGRLCDALQTRLTSQSMQLFAQIGSWAQSLLDDPNCGVDGARYAAETVRSRIRDLLATLARKLHFAQEAEAAARLALTTASPDAASGRSGQRWSLFRSRPDGQLAQNLVHYGTLRLEVLVLTSVHRQLRLIESHTTTLIDRLLVLWTDLKQLTEKLASPVERGWEPFSTNGSLAPERLALERESGHVGTTSPSEQYLSSRLRDRRSAMVRELQRRLESDRPRAPGMLQRLLEQRTDLSQLSSAIRRHARQVVLQTISQLITATIEHQPAASLDNTRLDIAAVASEAVETPWNFPGERQERVLVVVPEAAPSAFRPPNRWATANGVTVVPGRTSGIAICRELERVPLQTFADTFIHGQQIYRELAENLHTRTDVEWQPFPAPAMVRHADDKVRADESGFAKTEPLPCLST